ncbi:hypothetical protein [Streptomyces mutabilis]|uniref:Uncharacterized protein n=1 Tax=Streptomyces mutabilis TaxID=67332 RepID=A0A086MX99_9ACTN|nr:hypothetical protein [Streptomyces mutabilis]KFG73517.1 hypothetical protein FM21_22200 [Streptomyces mutabilis]
MHVQLPTVTTGDYRLLDIQRAVVPTTLPPDRFCGEPVRTQTVINRNTPFATGRRAAAGSAPPPGSARSGEGSWA